MPQTNSLPILAIAGNISSLLMYASLLLTIYTICNKRSIGLYSVAPSIMGSYECALSLWYDRPDVSPTPPARASIVSEIGLAVHLINLAVFLCFATEEQRKDIWRLILDTAPAFLIVGLVTVYAVDREKKRMIVCGIAYAAVSIISYGSPLAVTMTVVKTKSVKYMPLEYSACVFVSSAIWFSYGAFVKRDLLMCIGNAAGFALGSAQLMLYAAYRNNKENDETTDESNAENKNDERGEQKPGDYLPKSEEQYHNRLNKKLEELFKKKGDSFFPEAADASCEVQISQV